MNVFTTFAQPWLLLRLNFYIFFLCKVLTNFCFYNQKHHFKFSVCDSKIQLVINYDKDWRCGVVVITTAQLHSPKPELRFWTGLYTARGVLEIRDGEDEWSWLETTLFIVQLFHKSNSSSFSSKLLFNRTLPAKGRDPTTSPQQVNGGNTPNLVLKRMKRYFLKIPPPKKLLQF